MKTITLRHKTDPDVKLEIKTNRPDLINDIVKGVSNSFNDYEVVKDKVAKVVKEEVETLESDK